MPVIPLVISGAEVVLPKHSLLVNWGHWRQKVIMEFLPPIYPEGPSEEQVPILKEKTRQAMAGCLAKHWSADFTAR
jgi:1-acyl-sn-glycerol-3-phosphate acyltransferase